MTFTALEILIHILNFLEAKDTDEHFDKLQLDSYRHSKTTRKTEGQPLIKNFFKPRTIPEGSYYYSLFFVNFFNGQYIILLLL